MTKGVSDYKYIWVFPHLVGKKLVGLQSLTKSIAVINMFRYLFMVQVDIRTILLSKI